MRPGSLDLAELHHRPDANEEAKGKDEPPEPGILVPHKVGAPLHNQRPLGEGKTKAGEGAIPCCDCVAETHEKHKANPVEEEGGEKCSEENKVVAKKGDILLPFPVVPRGISPSSPARSWLLSLIFHIASKQLLFQLLRLLI